MGRKPGHGPDWEVRRQEIIDLAADLFATKSYVGTGISDLSKATGLGTGALYYYIGSKEELLVEIFDRVMVPLLTIGRRVVELDAPVLVRLRLLSQAMVELILSRTDHLWVFENDYRHVTKKNRKKVTARRHQFEDIVVGLFAEAGEIGALRVSDPKLMMLQFFNLHNHTYTWAASMKSLKAESLSREFCDTLFFGWHEQTSGKSDLLEKEVADFREGYDGPSLSWTR